MPDRPKDNSITLEGVTLLFRNFAGREKQYNRPGDRNFCILLSPEQADYFSQNGWNVKTTKERELDEGETYGGDPYLPVKVSYTGSRPPKIVMITSRGKTNLDEDMLELIDFSEIVNADVIVRPYDWDVNGKTGRKAYLRSIYVTIYEDELDLKYADVKIAGASFQEDEDVLGEPDADELV